ncbi:MAG TPA: adenylate/guanylate cyclase domain-containing protein [Acidimicrobiales bacterium]|nr:adenylate/guanylate cyclase domain-containing protein [Acidimicrobiales bacterium]
MEPAPELIAFAERILLSSSSLYTDVYLDGFSRHPGVRFIGPDPEEWWEGFEQIAAVGKAQSHEMKELGGIRVDTDEIVAWKEGTVGWIAVRCRLSFGQSTPREVRMTMIVHEDGAFWRMVHHQLAFTVANEETLGLQLTTAVDQLLLLVQGLAPPTAGMSPDGTVTIMFTDVEGSTALMESLGEDRWLELLAWHDSIVLGQSAVFGGTVVKGQGDGFMLAFPAAGSAAACAVAIQRSLGESWNGVPIPARIGLHTGNARAEGGDFFGRTVVVAARISSMASGGEILLSQEVQADLKGAFPLEGPRALSLKGLSGLYTVFELAWQ